MAAQLDRSVGELFRMIMVLEQRGYVARSGKDEFELTLRLFELALSDAPVQRLTAAAADPMMDLASATQQSCHLVIYSNGRGIVIAKESSPADRGFSVRLGAEAPLLQSCSGHLLLAYADVRARTDMLKGQPKAFRKPLSDAAVQRIINRVLRQGYESNKSEQVSGVLDIGYPVFDHTGNLVAALVIPFLEHIDGSHPVSFDACRECLADTAAAISKALGYTESARAQH